MSTVPTSLLELEAARPASRPRWMEFWDLAKPRMNFLVLATTTAGFAMAVRSGGGAGQWLRLPHVLIGAGLCAAGAAALNQLIERRLDALMPRTRNRPLPAGRVSPTEAAVYGLALSLAGVLYLYLLVNPLTAFLGGFTIASYVLIYTPLKRRTTLNTVIGALPGAIPPVMGWTAASGSVSQKAVALLMILFVWQIPHFLAIAIMYRQDYAAGGFKMLPVVDADLKATARQIVLYAAALIPVSLAPTMLGMTGEVYGMAAVLLGLAQFSFAVSCATTRSRDDARKLFLASIVYLPLLLAAMMFDRI
jgi:heme o synthase